MVDWRGSISVMLAAPRDQLFTMGAMNVLRYHKLILISCYSRDCKALLVLSLFHKVRSLTCDDKSL